MRVLSLLQEAFDGSDHLLGLPVTLRVPGAARIVCAQIRIPLQIIPQKELGTIV